jgi:class 3 adenylate cyclase
LLQTLWTQGVGWSHPDFTHRWIELLVSHLTQREFESGNRIQLGDDVTELLPSVETETLVIHREESVAPSTLGHKLAASLPNARLLAMDGDSLMPFLGNGDLVLDTIRDFIGVAASFDAKATGQAAPSAFRTILFTDLESSTALTQAIGDAKAQDILHGHNKVVRAALAAHDGEEVKHTGDGIMASFGSAVSAVQAALQIQRDLAGGEIRVRIGLNAGEPIAEGHDYFGTAVQLAARICDRSDPGQVLVSNVVRELCAGETLTFADQGEGTLKGFPEPVRLYAVEPPAEAN